MEGTKKQGPVLSGRLSKLQVGDKRSRGKLSAGFETRGFANKKWECYAAQNTRPKNYWRTRRRHFFGPKVGRRKSPYEEGLALHLSGFFDSKSFRGWKGRRAQPVNKVSFLECHHEARHEDHQRRNVVQKIMQKSTDVLRRITVPVEGDGALTLSYVCPHRDRYPLEDYIWWVSTGHRKNNATGGARRAADRAIGGAPTGLGYTGTPARRRFFGPMLHLRARARISCTFSCFWRISR